MKNLVKIKLTGDDQIVSKDTGFDCGMRDRHTIVPVCMIDENSALIEALSCNTLNRVIVSGYGYYDVVVVRFSSYTRANEVYRTVRRMIRHELIQGTKD